MFRVLESDDASTSAGGTSIINGGYTQDMLEMIVTRAKSEDKDVQLAAVQQVGEFFANLFMKSAIRDKPPCKLANLLKRMT